MMSEISIRKRIAFLRNLDEHNLEDWEKERFNHEVVILLKVLEEA